MPRIQSTGYFQTTNRDGYREYKSKSYLCKDCPQRSKCTMSKDCTSLVTRRLGRLHRPSRASDTPIWASELIPCEVAPFERCLRTPKRNMPCFTLLIGLTRVSNWVRSLSLLPWISKSWQIDGNPLAYSLSIIVFVSMILDFIWWKLLFVAWKVNFFDGLNALTFPPPMSESLQLKRQHSNRVVYTNDQNDHEQNQEIAIRFLCADFAVKLAERKPPNAPAKIIAMNTDHWESGDASCEKSHEQTGNLKQDDQNGIDHCFWCPWKRNNTIPQGSWDRRL